LSRHIEISNDGVHINTFNRKQTIQRFARFFERGIISIALSQVRLHARCNQFTGQLKLWRLCVIGLANGGVGQQLGFYVFQAFHVYSSKRSPIEPSHAGSSAKGKFPDFFGVLCDEHLSGDAQTFVQIPDHAQR
jgi:hypothetical protein